MMDWSGVDYMWIIVMFLSALILTAPIHYRGHIAEQVMSCNATFLQIWWRNKLLYILNGLRFANLASFRSK